jgi:predicted ABC-type sugar transport system permease subunit
MKKWNWSLFLIILCVGNIGALSNKNFETIPIALLFGTAFGLVFGLLMAYITRED